MSKSRLSLVIIALVTALPALAEDGADTYQVTPCNFGCKLWRNVSGHVSTPLPASAPDAAAENAIDPTPEEEARKPDVNRLVAVHGEIVRKSRQERAREKAVRAQQDREIAAMQPNAH